MAAGIIDHESGTRDIRRLSGLFRFMPITATLAMVAAAAMAGVPLLNGFLSKEMFFAEAAAFHVDSLLDHSLPYFAMLASAFSVAYSLRFIHGVFFGPPATDLPRTPHEPPHWMRFPVEFLVLACLLVGILPAMTIKPFLATAVRAVLGPDTPYYSLAIWHGFNEPLLMSVIALIGGVLLYWLLQGYLKKGIDGPPLVRHLKGQRIFERVLVTLSWKWARSLERLFGTQRLQPQLRLLVGFAVLAALWPLYRHGLEAGSRPGTGFDPAFLLLWIVGGLCAIGAAYQAKYHRLAAMVLLGGAGLVTCITFVWFSAPDLAITQLLVEIVTTVLILLGLRWLPKRIETAGEGLTMGAAGQGAAGPGPDAGRRGRHGHDAGRLRDADAAAPGHDLALLRRERLRGGRRPQRRQRHPGRLPRLRHLRRDRGARRGGDHGLLPAAPLPPGARERRRRRSSSRCRMPMTRPARTARSATPSPIISRSRR